MMVQYLIESGLRKVKPYYFTHKTNCKGRWFGRTVVDVFASEFRDRPMEYYEQQIYNGNFKIYTRASGGKPLQGMDELLHYKIQNGDKLEYSQHQHEPVVPYVAPVVIYEDDDLVVIDKPSGVPVHPTQKYYYNSVSEILQHELQSPKLFPCHRLDKLTSGVLIFGKNPKSAKKIQIEIQNKTNVDKLYIARVVGEFPAGEITCTDPVINIQTKKSFVGGVPEAKSAITVFQRLAYDKFCNQSIVECRPITGRTHQIRLHLRNLGHWIVNDPLYGKGCLLHSVKNDISEGQFDELMAIAEQNRSMLQSCDKCKECDADLYKDYKADKLIIWLHSLRYKIGDLNFQTGMPSWSKL